jgi:hypothetical protein
LKTASSAADINITTMFRGHFWCNYDGLKGPLLNPTFRL